MDLIDCPNEGCNQRGVDIGGNFYVPKRAPRSSSLIFVSHTHYVVPEAKSPDKIYISIWVHKENGRKRYSNISRRINEGILRAPDLYSHDYRFSQNKKSTYTLDGV